MLKEKKKKNCTLPEVDVSTLAEERKQFPIGSSPEKLSLPHALFAANNQQIIMDSESLKQQVKDLQVFGLPLNFTEVTQNSSATKLENGFSSWRRIIRRRRRRRRKGKGKESVEKTQRKDESIWPSLMLLWT
jgi:hypothetical protein